MPNKLTLPNLPVRYPKKPAEGELDNVSFASDAARSTALKAGLSAAHFTSAEATSENGFTVADVRQIVGEG